MTTNEIAVQQFNSLVPLDEKITHAKALAASGMIPKVYQDKPANVLVAIELGEALGIRPIVAINEINVINGTPSPSASLMASLARNAGHKVRPGYKDGVGFCEIVRADDPDYVFRTEWDEKKARAAGLWGKGHWAKDAEVMLQWRAISACVRLACSEVLGGLKYTPDEVENFDTAPVQATSQRMDQPAPAPASAPAAVTAADIMGDPERVAVDLESVKQAAAKLGTYPELLELYKEHQPNLTAQQDTELKAFLGEQRQRLEPVQASQAAQAVADEAALDDAHAAELPLEGELVEDVA